MPIVIPIVLHHGEHGWTQPVTLRDLYDAPPEVLDALRPYLVELTFVLDDLAPQDDAALRARALSAVPMTTLWDFRHVRRNRDIIPVLRRALDLLVEVVRAPNGLAALAAADRLREEGRQQNQRENVLMLLNQRFGALPEPLLTHIRRADFAQLQHWFKLGITAERLDDVFADEPWLGLTRGVIGALPKATAQRRGVGEHNGQLSACM